MFREIEIRDWRQFAHIHITFHQHLTVLTGANGAGKTTILNILNRHFGWGINFIGTPRKTKKGVLEYISDLFRFRDVLSDTSSSGAERIGEITYWDNTVAPLTVPKSVGVNYQVNIDNMQTVNGLFVPSHRPVYRYEGIGNIPTTVIAKEQLFSNYVDRVRSGYLGGGGHSASFRIKEALISLATFGYGNEVVDRNVDAVNTYEGFQKILCTVLPDSLGFRRFSIRLPEVVLETNSGEIAFDAVSGGVSAIIDMAWQFYMAFKYYGKFIAVVDEPENHLHPTLQKSLLPKFIEAFPDTQIIVATHNPFIVTSVPDSNVYVLDYDEDQPRRVNSRALDLVNRAGSANEILRDVLGLDNTKPLWVQDRLDAIVDRYLQGQIDDQQLRGLKNELRDVGLSEFFPETVARVLDRRQ